MKNIGVQSNFIYQAPKVFYCFALAPNFEGLEVLMIFKQVKTKNLNDVIDIKMMRQ